jgi:hypothetical protein
MMRLFVATATALLLGACATTNPAPTQAPAGGMATSTATSARPAAVAAAGGDDVVCVNERVTGSRHPKKVCYSASGYQALKETGQSATRDLQRMPNIPRTE